jgi:copper(I)-binding protein
MKKFLNAALVAAFVLGGPGMALGEIDVTLDSGTVWQTKKIGYTTQGFLQIHNTGSTADVLTGFNCTIADATLLVGADGKSLQSLTIPPGQVVTLAAKGPHLLLQNLHYTVDVGSVVPCSFTFQNAGDIGGYLNSVAAPTGH